MKKLIIGLIITVLAMLVNSEGLLLVKDAKEIKETKEKEKEEIKEYEFTDDKCLIKKNNKLIYVKCE